MPENQANNGDKENSNSLDALIENASNIEKIKKETTNINIDTFNDIIKLILINEYEYVILEGEKNGVKVSFYNTEKVIVNEKFITFPIYSNILIQSKQITNLKPEINLPQEGEGDYTYENKKIKVRIKTEPSPFGEKIFIQANIGANNTNKSSMGQLLTFMGALIFIGLILGGSFIVFIVMNAKTVEDVMFFNSLGISLNDVNAFIAKLVTIIFSLLIFIEVILFSIFGIKFLLTKKELKKRRVWLGLLSIFLLLITFISGTLWLATVQKVNALPNWQEMSYGDIQLYDNTKLLLPNSFTKSESLIGDDEKGNLIGPVTIKFDLTYYKQKEEAKGLKIEKFIWDFGNGEIKEEISPDTIEEFKEKGTYNVKVSVEARQIDGKLIKKEVENIPSISIKSIVKIKEESTKSGGKKVTFDASELRNYGKIEWYMEDNLEKPKLIGEIFTPGKIIFSDTLIGIYIQKEGKIKKTLDKIFLIKGEDETGIKGEIEETKTENDLIYEFRVKNLSNSLDSGFIEEFKWSIGDFQRTLKSEVGKEEISSKIKYTFTDYGKKEIRVLITDSYGKNKELVKEIEIFKELKFKNQLQIYNESELINPKYENNDYFIIDLAIPTTLKFDARLVKLDNPVYSLQEVTWDTNGDGINDESGKTYEYKVNIEGKQKIYITYLFKNIKDPNSTKTVKDTIYIDAIKKDAILDLEIIPSDSGYIPITVKFDASKSEVKGENIVKFIYDYGDGTPIEERDAVNYGHKYIDAGNYNVKLTVVTESGKEYSITKKLILKPRPQVVKITTSMKQAPTYQGIDFSSSESEGQITSYFWDFGDGETSTDANPTHAFKKPGEYTVKLKVDFINRNTLEDKINITITK